MKQGMRDKFKYAGKTVKVKEGVGNNTFGEDMSGMSFTIEDWAINLWHGTSWMDMNGNPAALEYAMRTGFNGRNNNVPTFSDDVLGGKIGAYSHLFHINELDFTEIEKG